MPTDQADVELKLGDETVTLRCTLDAAMTVNNTFGNFMAANSALEKFDFDAVFTVVAAGAGVKRSKVFDEKVFAAGMLEIHPKVRRYLDLLANNGRVYVAPKDGDAGDDSGNA